MIIIVLVIIPLILIVKSDKTTKQAEYYLDDEAREYAEFLHKNPEYKVLFDASRKVKKKDIEFVTEFIERMS